MVTTQLSVPYLRNLLHEKEEKLRLTTIELNELKRGLDESVIVSISNLKGEIIHTNAMMEKISGYSSEEILGKNHRLFNSGFHPRSFFKNLWETVLCGRVWKGEIKNKRKDGTVYWIDTTIVPFFDSNGHVFQFMSVRKDITARKLAEERIEIDRAGREFAGRLAAIGEMASNIAHEIRNPLSAIIMKAELTKRNANASFECVQAMEQVERLAKRIDRIIDGVRLLSRDGSKDAFETLSLSSLIGETIEMVSSKFENSGVALISNEVEETIKIRCRPIQISQVIFNLLNNALDAVQVQSEKWVRISVEESGAQVLILVTDSGSGIPIDIQDKIMQPYFTTKPLGKGTGLGLSISREILRAHVGDLFIDNDQKNTTFVARLPVENKTK